MKFEELKIGKMYINEDDRLLVASAPELFNHKNVDYLDLSETFIVLGIEKEFHNFPWIKVLTPKGVVGWIVWSHISNVDLFEKNFIEVTPFVYRG